MKKKKKFEQEAKKIEERRETGGRGTKRETQRQRDNKAERQTDRQTERQREVDLLVADDSLKHFLVGRIATVVCCQQMTTTDHH